MVLWEITLGTAYFLGLKRTYRLALKIQRRLISPKHPKIRQFVKGRTRAIFEVALKVHLNIQQRDLEVGRSLGNWILRYLDKMKPSAQIRSHCAAKPPSSGNANTNMTKQLTNSSHQKTPGHFQKFKTGGDNRESDRHLFTSSRNMWPKPFPTIAMMMRPAKPAGTNIQHRHLCFSGPDVSRLSQGRGGFEGVIRKDIMQWMVRN
ncbi:GTPase [Actinidia chinensis var. chinensis]|uniref:GTPase n=1 Tax=Actinidia chinensis var. chinensis TaxID=1590841 RepID=A0A2R6PMK7_ACTCC|nr:GTPase [Actinidia chinensis var. chinensis]